MGQIFDLILVHPILNILVAIYHAFYFIHLPYALGFSIIALTVLIRFATYPLISSQLKTSKKMQELNPHLSRLKEKHKNDSKRLQQETMNLYKEHGVNPALGCLPLLVQLPILWALYSVLGQVANANTSAILKTINHTVYFPWLKLTTPWDQNFFGLSLGQNPAHLVNSLPFIILVPVITGVLQLVQSKMMFARKPQSQDKKIAVKKEGESQEDFASAFQSQSTFIFPAMIGFLSYNYPLGLSLYWNTLTIFGIIQQYKISGLGGLSEWTEKIWTPKKKN